MKTKREVFLKVKRFILRLSPSSRATHSAARLCLHSRLISPGRVDEACVPHSPIPFTVLCFTMKWQLFDCSPPPLEQSPRERNGWDGGICPCSMEKRTFFLCSSVVCGKYGRSKRFYIISSILCVDEMEKGRELSDNNKNKPDWHPASDITLVVIKLL